jgi:predicted lysophospholipase L1 biosynthesis ABC-type transport system permease subunit
MIIYKLRDPDRAPALASHFEKLFQHGADSCQQREESTLQLFLTLRMSVAITVSLIILLAGFGIFNVLTMSVLAKIKEIAILRSMGYRRIDISAIFLWQGALIAVAGSVLGCLLGALMTWGVSHIPIRIRGLLYTDYFFVTWDWRHYVFATLLAILAVFIASYVPARRAAELPPVATLGAARAYERGNLPVAKQIERYLGEEESASMRCVASRSISIRPASTLLSARPAAARARCSTFSVCSIRPMPVAFPSNRNRCCI